MSWFTYKGINFIPPPEEITHQILLVEAGIIKGWVYELSVHPSICVEAFVGKENCIPVKIFKQYPFDDYHNLKDIPELLHDAKKAVINFINIQ